MAIIFSGMPQRFLPSSSPARGRRRLLRRLAVLSAAASAYFAAPAAAHAQSSSSSWIPGVGLFFGYAFGANAGFEAGVETFATYRFTGLGCSSTKRSGIGPLLQFTSVDFGPPRITLAAQGGGEIDMYSSTALTAELGGTYFFGETQGFAIHTGLTPEFAIFNVSARAQWFKEEVSLTAGARYLATYGGPGYCVEGRPLRTSSGCVRHDGPTEPRRPSPRIREEALLAGWAWERAAQDECASVPAFLHLAAELLAHDAPDALIERCLVAAEDEMVHARLAAELASRYLASRVDPTYPAVAPRPPLAGQAGLVRLATESWLDGCLGEGMAAARAARAARLDGDSYAQSAQRTIARDEARHAELGWSILQWATEVGGDDVRDAVRGLRDAEMGGTSTEGSAVTERYGRLGPAHVREVTERHCTRSRARLDALL